MAGYLEWESGDVIEGPVVAGRGVGGGRGPPGAGIFKAWERRATRMPRLHISHAQPPLVNSKQNNTLRSFNKVVCDSTEAYSYRSKHRGQFFSSLGTIGIGPDTGDERARPLHSSIRLTT